MKSFRPKTSVKSAGVCLGRLQFGVPHVGYDSTGVRYALACRALRRKASLPKLNDKLKHVGHSARRSKPARASSCFAQLVGPLSSWSRDLFDDQLTDLATGFK